MVKVMAELADMIPFPAIREQGVDFWWGRLFVAYLGYMDRQDNS